MIKSRRQGGAKKAAAQRPRPMVVELNFLPDRYRGRGLRVLTTLRPWLFLAGFALLLIPSLQLFQRQAVELAAVEAELAAVAEALEGYQPLADERALLEARVTSAEAQIVEIQAAYDTIDIRNVTWSEILPLILGEVPGGVELTLVSQSDEEVVLEGVTDAYRLPSVLADSLDALGRFESVTIQSVVRANPQENPELVPVEAPPLDDGGEESSGEQPADAIEAAIVVVPSIGVEDERPPRYRFRITILLPLFMEPTPEPADEG